MRLHLIHWTTMRRAVLADEGRLGRDDIAGADPA
jgi:hypothetical protein